MLIYMVLLLTVLPIVELAVLIQFNSLLSMLVGPVLGLAGTIALTVGKAALGGWLARQQGMKVLLEIQEALARGEVPTEKLVDGALILVGGVMLLTPGLITDTVGLTFLFPATRAMYRRYARSWVQRQYEGGRVFVKANAGSWFSASFNGAFEARPIRRINPDEPGNPPSA